MDYCDPNSFIGNFDPNYLPSSGGTNTINTKNIDCVSLESNTIITDNLTIGGIPFDTNVLTDLNTKTQNQSATAGTTVFTGNLTGDMITSSSLKTNGLSAKDASQITITSPLTTTGSITAGTQLLVNSTSSTSDPLGQFFKSSMTAGTNVAVQLGRNSTTAGLLEYNYTGVSTTNYVTIKPIGAQYGPQVTTTGTYVPNKLYVSNTEIVPRQIAYSGVPPLPAAGVDYYFGAISGVSGLKRIVVSLQGVTAGNKTAGSDPNTSNNSTFYIQVGVTNGPTSPRYAATGVQGVFVGTSVGNNAAEAVTWNKANYNGVPLWNTALGPANASDISGVVELTYAGLHTGTQQQWNVYGLVSTGTSYWCYISGVIKLPASIPTINFIRLGNYCNCTAGTVNYLFY